MLNFSKYKIFTIILVCLVSVIYSLPNFLPKNSTLSKIIPTNAVNFGLDLKGGSYLLLQIDTEYYLNEKLINLKNEIKKEFRENIIRSIPTISNKKIIFTIKNKEQYSKVRKIINESDSDLITNDKDGVFNVYFSHHKIAAIHKNLVSQSIEIVRRRIDENGTKEPVIRSKGHDRILLQVPGVDNPEQIRRVLGKTAKMTFHFVSDNSFDKNALLKNTDRSLEKISDKDGKSYLIKKEAILSGDMLTNANVTYYQGEPAVSFKFNNVGAKKFAKVTKNNIGKIFAIVLDKQIITAPRINSVIDQGLGVISGEFTVKEAHELALLLRAGALPAPILILEERTVGPSLGIDSIKHGTLSSLVGLLLVAVFMILFYKIFGVIAVVALIINISIVLTLLSLVGATLTLPGIAGIVLTIGMAVDANVLIFERIKEEYRNNNNVINSINLGFSQAFRTILDSNVTTLIVAVLLYIFGTGLVKSFAITLSFGILASMFSAIMLTRLMVVAWIKINKPKHLNL